MDIVAAISLASTVIKTLIEVEPIVVKTVSDLKPFGVALVAKFTGKDLTSEQRTEVEAKLDELHVEFQKPIPAAEQQ